MWKLKYKGRNRGFTLIEILVTIGIIAVLAGIGVVTIGKVKGANSQTTCISNLRSLSQGLQSYYNDYMTFPADGYPEDGDDMYPLSTELANYINDKSTFVCPGDDDTTSIANFASYDPYYVARKGSYDSNELALGCPRHRGAKNSTTAFSTGSTEITSVGTVLDKNLQEIPPDGTTAQRTISSVNDTMTFADNSTVTVTNASGGSYGCFLVQSVRLSDGTLYSIVKVQDSGTIDVQVTTGSKFEVVTPSAIVGVRGTEFTVATSDNGSEIGYQTVVTQTAGIVVVTDRETGNVSTLETSGTRSTTTGDVPLHSHYHTHVDGERHMHEHPSQNQAHHGKPKAGTDDDDDDSSSDDEDKTICHKPGTPAEKTMVIPQSAWSGHEGHGDTQGACSP
jgi:prepilin-type N-terminal cleavage/methylation domain-containing protein